MTDYFQTSIKKWLKGKKVIIRSPNSTRPWQNVLDVIRGYSILAAKLSQNKKLHGAKHLILVRVVKITK